MVDFHTHILPGMDDGSKSLSESLQMLLALKEQGVDTVVATPHYYAHRESPEEFLHRRQQAIEQLRPCIPEGMQVILAAEVRYYEGIGRLPQLRQLQVENTDVLLLEMPEETWTGHMVQELQHLAGTLQLVIAHIERAAPMQKKATLESLRQRGVLFQSNASFFLGTFSRWKARRLLEQGHIHLLGSDCHNKTTRPPRMGAVCRDLARWQQLARLEGRSRSLLNL